MQLLTCYTRAGGICCGLRAPLRERRSTALSVGKVTAVRSTRVAPSYAASELREGQEALPAGKLLRANEKSSAQRDVMTKLPWWHRIVHSRDGDGMAFQDAPLQFASMYAAGIVFVHDMFVYGGVPAALASTALLSYLASYHLRHSFF
ncbi:hypothetical protein D9Q98_004017 [Chlorella vulgaris]|uniref:Uncharacterized protein n=1 Tax=Chlorella vulgaris TaxID=3077 RepID=A0A9D4TRA7_CHLVU|nr:hypothetical protein D9Q98_004017 [Chlorella vulgaris]